MDARRRLKAISPCYFGLASVCTGLVTYLSLSVLFLFIAGCDSDRIRPSADDVRLIQTLLENTADEQQMLGVAVPVEDQEQAIAAMAVLSVFWNPKDLERYGVMRRYDLYEGKKYLLAQTEVNVATRKDSWWPVGAEEFGWDYDEDEEYPSNLQVFLHQLGDSHPHFYDLEEAEWDCKQCTNLYPRISIPDSSVLYLTPELEQKLLNFLGEDFTEFGTPSIMSTVQARDCSAERHAAADRFLTVIPDHWGDGWHLVSHPDVRMILFNQDYSRAFVSFRIGYEGGYTSLRKDLHGWVLDESMLWWVE